MVWRPVRITLCTALFESTSERPYPTRCRRYMPNSSADRIHRRSHSITQSLRLRWTLKRGHPKFFFSSYYFNFNFLLLTCLHMVYISNARIHTYIPTHATYVRMSYRRIRSSMSYDCHVYENNNTLPSKLCMRETAMESCHSLSCSVSPDLLPFR